MDKKSRDHAVLNVLKGSKPERYIAAKTTMPSGMKHKPTLSADLSLEAQAASTSRIPWVPSVETEGNHEDNEDNISSTEDDGPSNNNSEGGEGPGSQPQPGPSSVSQKNPKSCSRAQRKKRRHLPHHHKLLNKCVNE